MARASRELSDLSFDEAQVRALHLVAFAIALQQAYGDVLSGLIKQLSTLAAIAVSDPGALCDAVDRASMSPDAALRIIGSASPKRLSTTTPEGAVSILALRAMKS